jgi:preprotein translocase subunit SecF
MQMNHDMVFWGVIIGVASSALVVVWLLYMLYKNATKSKNNQ